MCAHWNCTFLIYRFRGKKLGILLACLHLSIFPICTKLFNRPSIFSLGTSFVHNDRIWLMGAMPPKWILWQWSFVSGLLLMYHLTILSYSMWDLNVTNFPTYSMLVSNYRDETHTKQVGYHISHAASWCIALIPSIPCQPYPRKPRLCKSIKVDG